MCSRGRRLDKRATGIDTMLRCYHDPWVFAIVNETRTPIRKVCEAVTSTRHVGSRVKERFAEVSDWVTWRTLAESGRLELLWRSNASAQSCLYRSVAVKAVPCDWDGMI